MIRYLKLSGATPDIPEGDDGPWTTGIVGWNLTPDVGYVLAFHRRVEGEKIRIELWNWDKSTLVAAREVPTDSTEEAQVVFTPEAGQTLGMLDQELGWHVLFSFSLYYNGPDEQEIRIPPLGGLPDINHPMYAPFAYAGLNTPGISPLSTDRLAEDKALAALTFGTLDIIRVTATLPEGLEAEVGDEICFYEEEWSTGRTFYIESMERRLTPDGTSVTVTARNFAATQIIPW